MVPGLALRVTASGHKSFVLVSRLHGRFLRLTWRWPAVSLAQARTLARDALHDIAQGLDPRRTRSPVTVDTFDAVASTFIALYAKPRKRTWAEDERILRTYVLPAWGARPVRDIGRRDVVALLDTIAAKNGPIMANRTLSVVKKLFAWSLNRGVLDAHPAAGLSSPAPERVRTRTLSDDEIRALWGTWSSMPSPWGVGLQLLLAARRPPQ